MMAYTRRFIGANEAAEWNEKQINFCFMTAVFEATREARVPMLHN